MNEQFVVTIMSRLDEKILNVVGPFDNYEDGVTLIENMINHPKFEYDCIKIEPPPTPHSNEKEKSDKELEEQVEALLNQKMQEIYEQVEVLLKQKKTELAMNNFTRLHG